MFFYIPIGLSTFVCSSYAILEKLINTIGTSEEPGEICENGETFGKR
jgi:hypothetical protein